MASNEGSPPVMSSKNPSPEKRKGISRKKKSASQTEVLEKAYVVEKYPCEATRSRLCRDLELTEKQLQIWFTHRRYKDRRDGIDDEELISKARGGIKHEASRKREIDLNSREAEDNNNNNTTFEDQGHPSRVLAEEHNDEEFMGEDEDEEDEEEVKVKARSRRKSGPKSKVVDHAERAAIAAIERQLGGPLRDDGPPLGFEFDPLPPDAFQQPTWTEGGYREGESEISDRDGREGNGEFQWRNGAMERKRKVG